MITTKSDPLNPKNSATGARITAPQAVAAPCPNCGYCPTCGRNTRWTGPYYPWPTSPIYRSPYYWTSTASSTISTT